MALKNELGNKYGRLTVIDRAENTTDGKARWLCQCECGNQCIVIGKLLRSGHTKSCGCLQKERTAQSNMNRVGSLVGQKFGKLQVLEEVGFFTHPNGKRSRLYKCLCDCGNYCEVQHQYLVFGDTTSCGCIRSKGEYQIEQLLKEHNISFQREYSFNDLIDKNKLRFDFAIFKQNELICLIEFHGTQHWQENNGFYDENIIKHDKMKIDYCNKNNIKLIIIKYKRNYDLKFEDLQLEGVL